MEMQNYSIPGKKLRNTASHSTNINIAKMVGHPTFSPLFFLLLLAVPVLEFYSSIAALKIFLLSSFCSYK